MSQLDCAHCAVRDRAACATLKADERTALARAGRRVTLGRGDTLFHAGDDSVACATLIRGALKIAASDAGGTERMLALVHPAGFVGELFSPFAHYDVVALTDSELCLFNRRDYEAAVARYPALAGALLRRAQEDLHQTREIMALMGRRGSAAKVAGLVLSLSRAAADSPCHGAAIFDLPLTRGEMAELLGLTIETVSRQLGRLEEDGLIAREGPRGIRILDAARLMALLD